jgi:hypothetical protein
VTWSGPEITIDPLTFDI